MGSTVKTRGAKLADDAFAHLFEHLHEGVYIGLVGRRRHRDPRRQSASATDLRLGA